MGSYAWTNAKSKSILFMDLVSVPPSISMNITFDTLTRVSSSAICGDSRAGVVPVLIGHVLRVA
jgi:hypothetical protein